VVFAYFARLFRLAAQSDGSFNNASYDAGTIQTAESCGAIEERTFCRRNNHKNHAGSFVVRDIQTN
jgi:hypothetical protein